MTPRLPPPTRLAHSRCLAEGGRIQHLGLFTPLTSTRQRPPPRVPLQQPNRLLTTTACRPSNASWLLSALPNFSPNPSQPPTPKTLRARRLLPYPPQQIYALIADIDSYSRFLPHCTHSRVTRWTHPLPSPTHPSPGARHPALADLTVGWGPFTQTYTSRVYCVPGSVVEAVSGRAGTSISADTLRSAGYEVDGTTTSTARGEKDQSQEMAGGIFDSLVTRWTVQSATIGRMNNNSIAGVGGDGDWTEVTLSVTFAFANPALGFAVGQVADEKVSEMVEAFEGRARELYGRR